MTTKIDFSRMFDLTGVKNNVINILNKENLAPIFLKYADDRTKGSEGVFPEMKKELENTFGMDVNIKTTSHDNIIDLIRAYRKGVPLETAVGKLMEIISASAWNQTTFDDFQLS